MAGQIPPPKPTGFSIGWAHRRRVKTEEKAKFVAVIRGRT